MEKRSFAFLAHRVESWNWLLNFRVFNHLHRKPELHWLWIWMAPLYWTFSILSLFSKKGYETVDNFQFAGMKGQTILLRNYAWHFLSWKHRISWKHRKSIKKRILDAVLSAQEENQVIGLGALTKAEWLTKGGRWIVDELGDRLHATLIHGDTLTAAVCLKQIDVLIKKFNLRTAVFITGATSKIGRAVALTLAKNHIYVKMYTRSRKRFLAIQKEAGESKKYIIMSTSLKDGEDCQLWITGKSQPAGKKLLRTIPKRAVVVNFSVPNPLGENNQHPRKDILVIEGGLLSYDPSAMNLHFTMRLRPGLTYACHAATAVHAYKGWKNHEVDNVDLKKLRTVWEAAQELGFSLPIVPQMTFQTLEQPAWERMRKLVKMPTSIVL